MTQHTEKAFESVIEDHLLTKSGYISGNAESFDRQLCLDPTVLIPFIQKTQPQEWEYLRNIQKDKAQETLISDLVRALDSEHEGCLKVLRHGFKCFGKLFHVAYFAPASKMNPENPEGHKTAYLWEKVLQRDSFLDILARFIHIQVEEKKVGSKKVKKETMIFPRYHQLDVVRKLDSDAKQKGVGNNYLVEHSAGSGKSNSIAWLAHRLASLHDESDEKVFDSVVVITDRRVLDQQLQGIIYQFEHKQGVVQRIDEDTKQLVLALAKGTPIVISTLQKFSFIVEQIHRLREKKEIPQDLLDEDGMFPDRKYAVIIDEAHSSQGGESTTDLKGTLAASQIKEEAEQYALEHNLPDYEEEVLRAMAKRGHQPNISFFAFTATPKYKTLEVFGSPGSDGKPVPFHLYSMRQAIEENFILDVLKHYTTYKTYYRLIKSVEDDPELDKKKAARALARFLSLHPHNIAQKTEVMVEHFRTFVMHKIGTRAKAMVVTSSRLHAVRYKQEFDKYIAAKGYSGIKTLVAFSGKVTDPDLLNVDYTEVGMNNGIREKEFQKIAGQNLLEQVYKRIRTEEASA